MYEPLIHILMPALEPRADFLRAAIDSVITQTEKRWTLHINDDASVTDICTIVAPYLHDPRITFARNKRHLGIGGNWNSCLKKVIEPNTYPSATRSGSALGSEARARGENPSGSRATSSPRCRALGVETRPSGNLTPNTYIQFLFQDDLWLPTYLEHSLHIFETHPTVGFISVNHNYECEKGLAVRPLYDDLQQARNHLLTSGLHPGQELLRWWLERGLHPNLIGEPSFVMLRQSLVERVGMFSERMPQFLDVEYWTRCLAQTDWYFLKENLGTFRVHADGASERNRQEHRGITDRLLCVERGIRLLPKTLRPRSTAILSQTLEDMIGKFRREKESGSMVKNPLRLLPILPFCLRHPILIGSALLHTH